MPYKEYWKISLIELSIKTKLTTHISLWKNTLFNFLNGFPVTVYGWNDIKMDFIWLEFAYFFPVEQLFMTMTSYETNIQM